MPPLETTDTAPDLSPSPLGAHLPFTSMRGPGAYLCHWSGHLLRITPHSLEHKPADLINLDGIRNPRVTKLSDDPFIPARHAREIAANWDLPVNF